MEDKRRLRTVLATKAYERMEWEALGNMKTAKESGDRESARTWSAKARAFNDKKLEIAKADATDWHEFNAGELSEEELAVARFVD